MSVSLPADADFISFSEMAKMSPQDVKLMSRPDAPIKRDEALRWLARQNRATRKAAAGSAVSAGPVNPKFVGVDPDMSPEELEAAMAAAAA
eukprot:7287067-Karenia_brevis.AAC.1